MIVNRPVPIDDGAAAHLSGLDVPSLALPSTLGGLLDIRDAARDLLVIYVYPRTGQPDEPLPAGWDEIPGARGCTPQSCAFRDHIGELAENTFYEVYASRNLQEKYRAVMVHSPATNKDYELDCNHSGSLIACTSSPLSQDIYVSFPQAAIAAYTESQASAYASKRDVGHPGVTAAHRIEETEARPAVPKPESGEGEEGSSSGGEDEVGSSSHATDAKFCSEHECIGSFTTEGGTVVECSDGTYSHAGGISGACSHHGGEAEG
jgi:hypothetical protein